MAGNQANIANFFTPLKGPGSYRTVQCVDRVLTQ